MRTEKQCLKNHGWIMLLNNRIAVWCTVALLSLFFTAVSANAASPWKWRFSMKSTQTTKNLELPSSIYVDSVRERYYAMEPITGSLHSYDKNGAYINTFNPGNKALDQPFAVVRDAEGILWVVEKGRNSLTRIDLAAKTLEPRILKADDREISPDRMSMDDGLFYILDKYTGDVIVFDKDLQKIKTFSCTECKGGFVDFIVRDEIVWGLAGLEKAVYKFAAKSGILLEKIKLAGDLDFAYALEVGAADMLYVLDRHKGDISVFDQAGVFKYRFLEKGHSRGALYYPEDLLFDPWGRLCVVDGGNGRIEVFSR